MTLGYWLTADNISQQAEEQFRKTCKKFGASSKVWTIFSEHYFKRSMPDEARQLLQRSLLSLEKRKREQ